MTELLSGNEAIARGTYEAAADLGTGYPGTPSTEILETLAGYPRPHCQWSVNEKVALEVAAGASWAGGRVLVTMKHVGLNVAADPLFTLAYTGVRGGMVIVNADDPQQFSSQNEQDNRHYARAAKVPMLEPADSQECADFTRLAFELSERFDTPVILRTTTRISHSKSLVRFRPPLKRRFRPQLEKDPQKLVMVPAYGRRRHVLLEERLVKMREWAETAELTREIRGRGRSLGVISSGAAFQYAREAFPAAGFLKLGVVNPLPKERILAFAKRYRRLVIVEELDPFLEEQIRSWGVAVEGSERRSLTGELSPDAVQKAWGRPSRRRAVAVPDIPPRAPVLCPGCPHRGIFTVLRKKKIFVTGDIGCYTLAALPPLSALDTCLCMGASVGAAEGAERVLGDDSPRRVAAVIGDSTFFHSGVTPLIDAVYNRARTLTIVLDNRTTAMTGRQGHPGTGERLSKEAGTAVDIAALARGLGLKSVSVTKAWDLKGIGRAIERSLAHDGPAVIVNRGPCVLIDRKPVGPQRRVVEDRCTGCRRCLLVACPALSLAGEERRAKVRIDPLLCAGCGVCATQCRYKAIEAAGG